MKGCQKAVDFLTDYYSVRRLRIVLDGRRVPRKCFGVYFKNTAYFTTVGKKAGWVSKAHYTVFSTMY